MTHSRSRCILSQNVHAHWTKRPNTCSLAQPFFIFIPKVALVVNGFLLPRFWSNMFNLISFWLEASVRSIYVYWLFLFNYQLLYAYTSFYSIHIYVSVCMYACICGVSISLTNPCPNSFVPYLVMPGEIDSESLQRSCMCVCVTTVKYRI